MHKRDDELVLDACQAFAGVQSLDLKCHDECRGLLRCQVPIGEGIAITREQLHHRQPLSGLPKSWPEYAATASGCESRMAIDVPSDCTAALPMRQEMRVF